jgi:uncharacterized protein (DUF433 family)
MTKTQNHDHALKECLLISVNPDIMDGQPCVAGTRIPVHCVLHSLREWGYVNCVKNDYPSLTFEQIKEAIYFAELVLIGE